MIRTVINFPFSGYNDGELREKLFWQIVETCRRMKVQPIVVVISEDTVTRGGAEAFLHDPRIKEFDLRVHRTMSVDTCQTWLSGWAVALGVLPCTGPDLCGADRLQPPHDEDRIVLLPGDIDRIADSRSFFAVRLHGFLAIDGQIGIVVGDFETGEKLGTKDLIDLYGTYPLFALWFPEIAVATRDLSIWKPRSEFLNVRARELRDLLMGPRRRKFAYEQTLNMLIQSWNFDEHAWKYDIAAHRLGVLADDPDSRSIPGAIDQIERTERMLKMIWREREFRLAKDRAETAGSPDSEEYADAYRKLSAEILERYDRLESTSRSIEAVARVTVQSFVAK